MNKNLIYYLLHNWRTRPDVTNQCKRIRDLLNKEYESDLDFLNEIITIIYDDRKIENDTFKILVSIVHGGFAPTSYTLDVSPSQEASFWEKLLLIFPNNGYTLAIYADSLVLAGEEEKAIPLFIKCFKLERQCLYILDGSICELLLESEYRLEYQLLLLESEIKDYYNSDDPEFIEDPEILEEIDETLVELNEEYTTKPEIIERLDRIVKSNSIYCKRLQQKLFLKIARSENN